MYGLGTALEVTSTEISDRLRVPEFPEFALVADLDRDEFESAIPSGEEASDFQWLSLRVWNAMIALLTSPRLALTSEQIIEGRVVAAQLLRMGPGPLSC